MSKQNQNSLDLIDKKILCELDQDCRQPHSKIAKKLRINRNVVSYRINNLEKEGIINKYICSVNLGKLGYKTYKINIKVHPSKKEPEFIEYLTNHKNTIHFLKLEGVYDYSLTVAVKRLQELDDMIMSTKNKFKNLIKDYSMSLVVYSRIFKLQKYLLNSKAAPLKFEKYSGDSTTIDIDEKDKKILRELSQNANIPITELAKKTKLTTDIVKYRMKNLKSIINSYRLILDVNKMGLHHYVILLRIRQATKTEENRLWSWCALKDNVFFCSKRIGYFDFAINIAITDINHLNEFLAELKSEFGEVIDSYETVINTKLLKLNYVPF